MLLPNLSIIADKRVRSEPDPLRSFDPVDDAEDCLRRYNAVQLEINLLKNASERSSLLATLRSAEPLLLDFVEDQASVCTLVGDVETTQLIQRTIPIGQMTISVASLKFVEDGGGAMTLSFWSDESIGRGAPLRFFTHALRYAKRLVFYNANFDLTVASRGDGATIARWQRRTFDPYAELRRTFGNSVQLKLAILLSNNGLDPKTATGTDAVQMYASGRYDELERYNRRDVDALHELVRLPSIVLSNGRTTDVAVLPTSARYAPDDPRSLVQGTSEWKRARYGLLTASVAGAALGLSGAFRSRDSIAAMLHAELGGFPGLEEVAPSQTAMERGRALEPLARRAYERLRGVRVEESGLHVHPSHPELAASPDGIVLRPDGNLSDLLVEIKVPKQNTVGIGLTDAYLCQLQMTMACTGTKRADFVVFLDMQGARTLSITRVERDDALLLVIERQLLEFHAEARRDDQPYPLNSSDFVELRKALRDTRENHVV
jgi:putative phage-type endonuclease